MGQEIERKFLVRTDAWRALGEPVEIRQGYLCALPSHVVRIRTAGERAWITVKGRKRGIARSEHEFEIPHGEAVEMLETLCQRPLIEKRRYEIEAGELTWEVDEFFGENAGLVVAEVELDADDQHVPLPEWIGEEVTHDSRYYNSNLTANPYRHWKR